MGSLKDKFKSALSGWYLWLFPLFAVIITAALLFDYYDKKGVKIKIYFDDAVGIEAGKTTIRFRGVEIGKVSKVSISEDLTQVVVHAELNRDSKRFAVDGSKFSLVIAKVGLQGISGLETLIEGNYIIVQPGQYPGLVQYEFKGLIGKDFGESLDDTSTYFVETGDVGSINAGDKVQFRGLDVGSVTKVTLGANARSVIIQLNVQKKFTKLIRTNTQFWIKSAIHAQLGLFNTDIRINSFDTLWTGGIEFNTPTLAGDVAKIGTKYQLQPTRPKDSEKWLPLLDF